MPPEASLPLLHVGCGREPLPTWLKGSEEVRLDIEPLSSPDIVASMTDMGDIGPFGAVYSSHCLEHLAPHEVGIALGEMRRVLAPGGAVIIVVPDLEDVHPTDDVLYQSPAGPICGLDMYYGLRSALPHLPHMAHRTGFVSATLANALRAAGFCDVKTERAADYNLIGTGRA